MKIVLRTTSYSFTNRKIPVAISSKRLELTLKVYSLFYYNYKFKTVVLQAIGCLFVFFLVMLGVVMGGS